jgi:hypothetical protein
MTFGFKVMKVGSKILGLLLIAALVMVTPAADARTLADHASASPHRVSSDQRLPLPERPAGCHAHGDKNPYVPPTHSLPPAPVSHQCCLTGHAVAVVQASFHTLTSRQWTKATLQIAPALTGSSLERLDVSLALSTEPPGMTPLRI